MHSRLHTQLGTLILLPAALSAGGCVQMTRHSNMMIFGTNTVVGVRAGVNATSVPEVSIGYTRQEAVVLPLVANVAEGSEGRLTPCDVSEEVKITYPDGKANKFPVHPCLLVAINGEARDSYSVLASFGGNFSGKAKTDDVEAQAGVAQYFATGVAAQLLALKGGAAVVAASQAATKSAETQVDQSTVRALFGGKPEASNIEITKIGRKFPDFEKALLAKIDAGTDASVGPSIKKFEADSKINTSVPAACSTKATCKKAAGGDAYSSEYFNHSVDMQNALDSWQ